jgi:Arc/MetJ-type ribon-helix-helix transcriptional regulator
MGPRIMKLVSVKIPEAQIDGLEKLVDIGFYPSRSTAIRVAIRDLLRKELWNTQRQSEVYTI